MGRLSRLMIVPALLVLLAIPACRTTAPQAVSGALPSSSPEQASGPSTAAAGVESERPGYTEADVHFMQGMIIHHAQAVRMSALVPSRSDHEKLGVLARRIGISQRDEIALMQRWLRRHDQPAPQPDLEYPWEHSHHAMLMPGMLTPDQMAQLAAASGTAFDRLFLQGMIQHHMGALTMVEELFGTPGAAQNPAIFEFASEVSGVQRSQIARMRALLATLPDTSNP